MDFIVTNNSEYDLSASVYTVSYKMMSPRYDYSIDDFDYDHYYCSGTKTVSGVDVPAKSKKNFFVRKVGVDDPTEYYPSIQFNKDITLSQLGYKPTGKEYQEYKSKNR